MYRLQLTSEKWITNKHKHFKWDLINSLTEIEPQTNPKKARREDSERKEYKESNMEEQNFEEHV